MDPSPLCTNPCSFCVTIPGNTLQIHFRQSAFFSDSQYKCNSKRLMDAQIRTKSKSHSRLLLGLRWPRCLRQPLWQPNSTPWTLGQRLGETGAEEVLGQISPEAPLRARLLAAEMWGRRGCRWRWKVHGDVLIQEVNVFRGLVLETDQKQLKYWSWLLFILLDCPDFAKPNYYYI